jgi:hypothetical protein
MTTKTKSTKGYNPLYWSLPLAVGLIVFGGAIFHASNTARLYLPEIAQVRDAVNTASKTVQTTTQQLPEAAKKAGEEAGKGLVIGAARTAAAPQTIVTDQLPKPVQAVVDPVGFVSGLFK